MAKHLSYLASQIKVYDTPQYQRSFYLLHA